MSKPMFKLILVHV